MQATIFDLQGQAQGTVELNDAIYGIAPNEGDYFGTSGGPAHPTPWLERARVRPPGQRHLGVTPS